MLSGHGILQPVLRGAAPDILAIGHITRDLQPDGSFTLGGTVTFAALTAARLGLTAAIVTSADPHHMRELATNLPGIGLAARPARATTTFVNLYTNSLRTQYLRARAEPLQLDDVPTAWLAAPIVLLGPLAQEISASFVTGFPRRPGTILAATPQGWLRRWDDDGRVWPVQWPDATLLLPLLDALILSVDDLLPSSHGQQATPDHPLQEWRPLTPLLIVTQGRHGATLYQRSVPEHFPAYPVTEVDPTGAGDVFAAAFLAHFYHHSDARQAVNFANCVASFAVEKRGIQSIPTLAMVEQRLHQKMRYGEPEQG